jgi:hypothetical protein
VEELERIVAQIRARWPKTRIIIRGDSGSCRDTFERLGAFSYKKRGFRPSYGARRMAETAALISDEVFADVPLRQWVISFPFPLRLLNCIEY